MFFLLHVFKQPRPNGKLEKNSFVAHIWLLGNRITLCDTCYSQMTLFLVFTTTRLAQTTVTPCLELMRRARPRQATPRFRSPLKSQTNQESLKEENNLKASKMLHLAQWSTVGQPWTTDMSPRTPVTTPLDMKPSTRVSKVKKSLPEFSASLKSALLVTQWPTGSIHLFPPPATRWIPRPQTWRPAGKKEEGWRCRLARLYQTQHHIIQSTHSSRSQLCKPSFCLRSSAARPVNPDCPVFLSRKFSTRTLLCSMLYLWTMRTVLQLTHTRVNF